MSAKTGTQASIDRIYVEVLDDPNHDASWLEQEGWEDRLAAYRSGEFGFVGVRLAADVVLRREGRVDETITITTPGLWSIESDSGDVYFRESAADGLDMLADDLVALGFSDEQIVTATADFAEYEIVYR